MQYQSRIDFHLKIVDSTDLNQLNDQLTLDMLHVRLIDRESCHHGIITVNRRITDDSSLVPVNDRVVAG